MLMYVDVCMRGRMYGRMHRRGTRVSMSAYMSVRVDTCVRIHVYTYVTCVYIRIYMWGCVILCACACGRARVHVVVVHTSRESAQHRMGT